MPGPVLTVRVPEGDSVYVLARRLDRGLKGKWVRRSDFRVPKLATRDLAGRTVLEHATYGKHLLTRFSGREQGDPAATLHSHLLMDGEWTVTRPGKRLPTRLMSQVRVILETDGGTGWGLRLHQLELVPTAEEHRILDRLGPDVLAADFTEVGVSEAVRRLLLAPEVPLVAALLDQANVAGLGNLWVNELAFLVGRHPRTPVGDLGEDGLTRLLQRAATALRHSATVPGAYQVTTGINRRGETHWVSGRQRRPCLRCGTIVQMTDEVPNDPARRRTWWCPQCQVG